MRRNIRHFIVFCDAHIFVVYNSIAIQNIPWKHRECGKKML